MALLHRRPSAPIIMLLALRLGSPSPRLLSFTSRLVPPSSPPSLVPSSRPFSSQARIEEIRAVAHERLQGRKRFYKRTSVYSVPPPSSAVGSSPQLFAPGVISAGVDGSDSGVTRRPPSSSPSSSSSSSPSPGLFGVSLDGLVLRTPSRRPLLLPTLALAHAIALEWDLQSDAIEPSTMPLMTLASTGLDQVSADRAFVEDGVMKYLANDTTCYFADPKEERVLSRLQAKHWTPLHHRLSDPLHLGSLPASVAGALTLTSGGLPHPPSLVSRGRDLLSSLSDLELAAAQSIAMEAKSFLVAAAVCRGLLDAEEAVKCGRVEEEFQLEQWGVVEGGHDLDRLNSNVQIRSSAIFLRLLHMH